MDKIKKLCSTHLLPYAGLFILIPAIAPANTSTYNYSCKTPLFFAEGVAFSFKSKMAQGSSGVFCISDSLGIARDTVSVPQDSIQFKPYKTKPSFGYHLLALPSYLLHWITRPVGEGIKMMETEFPGLFQGERGDFGVFPFFETGGETGTAYGALVFHRDFLKLQHSLRIEALFGSSNFNEFDFEYEIPDVFMHNDEFGFIGTYYNDPIESLFLGNDVPLADETRYSVEEAAADVEYQRPVARNHSWSLKGSYRNVIIRQSEIRDTTLTAFPGSRKGRTELLSLGTLLYLNFAEGKARAYKGRRFLVNAGYHQSINNNRFRFLKYKLEWQEFLDLPFLPNGALLSEAVWNALNP